MAGGGPLGWWELAEPGRGIFLQASVSLPCLVPGPGGLALLRWYCQPGPCALRLQSDRFGIWTWWWWLMALRVLVPANKADGDPAGEGTGRHCH